VYKFIFTQTKDIHEEVLRHPVKRDAPLTSSYNVVFIISRLRMLNIANTSCLNSRGYAKNKELIITALHLHSEP